MLHRELLPNGQTRLTFSLPAQDPPGEVSVVGDFNGWRAGMHQMLMSEDDIRQVSVTVEPGTHYFRYLATGGRWSDERDADIITEYGSVVHCADCEVADVPEQASGERRRGDMMDARLDQIEAQEAPRAGKAGEAGDAGRAEQGAGRTDVLDEINPRMDTDSDLAPGSTRR